MTTISDQDVPLFSGASGRKPQTEARRHVYRMLALILAHELHPDQRDGWVFGGVTHEPDLRRLRKAVRAVASEMKRKGER